MSLSTSKVLPWVMRESIFCPTVIYLPWEFVGISSCSTAKVLSWALRGTATQELLDSCHIGKKG